MALGGSFGRNRGSVSAVLALAMLALTAACVLTVEDERRLGEQFSHQVQLQKRIVSDPVIVAYVRDMGTRLGRAAGPQPFPLTFNVIEDNSVNAFAGPGGYIYVNTGLILKARNASELAAVMSHENNNCPLAVMGDSMF